MITHIIFDVGGVVVPERGKIIREEIADYLGISYAAFLKIYQEYKSAVTRGELSLLQFYRILLRKIGQKEITPEELVQNHLAGIKKYCLIIDPKVKQIIDQLKKNYILACLTNTEQEVAALNKEEGVYTLFPHQYLSTELKMMKPDAEIYEAVMRDLKVTPVKAVYIDDNIKYVEAAKSLGIHAIQFKDLQQLKLAFVPLQIKC